MTSQWTPRPTRACSGWHWMETSLPFLEVPTDALGPSSLPRVDAQFDLGKNHGASASSLMKSSPCVQKMTS